MFVAYKLRNDAHIFISTIPQQATIAAKSKWKYFQAHCDSPENKIPNDIIPSERLTNVKNLIDIRNKSFLFTKCKANNVPNVYV